MLDQTSTLAEYIHSTLMAIIYFVPTYSRIRVRRNPYTGKVIRMNLVVDELSQAVLMYIDAASLAVMDLAVNNGRISTGFHLETRYPIVVNVVSFEVTEPVVEREYSYIATVMDVIPSHDGVRVVLHPDASEGVPRDLVVLVCALGVVGHVQPDVLAIRYVAILY